MSAVSVGKLPQFLYYPGMKGIFEGIFREKWRKRGGLKDFTGNFYLIWLPNTCGSAQLS